MAEIPVNKPITVITEQNVAACLVGIQKDIGYIKEKLDKSVDDHERRLRSLEQTEEDCRQVATINEINGHIENHEGRIKDLESTHQQDTGVTMARDTLILYGVSAFSIIEGLVIVWQFIKGV